MYPVSLIFGRERVAYTEDAGLPFFDRAAVTEQILVLHFSIEAYERESVFSLPFGKYWSNLHIVSEKKFCLDP